jgi:hypothetical protein
VFCRLRFRCVHWLSCSRSYACCVLYSLQLRLAPFVLKSFRPSVQSCDLCSPVPSWFAQVSCFLLLPRVDRPRMGRNRGFVLFSYALRLYLYPSRIILFAFCFIKRISEFYQYFQLISLVLLSLFPPPPQFSVYLLHYTVKQRSVGGAV